MHHSTLCNPLCLRLAKLQFLHTFEYAGCCWAALDQHCFNWRLFLEGWVWSRECSPFAFTSRLFVCVCWSVWKTQKQQQQNSPVSCQLHLAFTEKSPGVLGNIWPSGNLVCLIKQQIYKFLLMLKIFHWFSGQYLYYSHFRKPNSSHQEKDRLVSIFGKQTLLDRHFVYERNEIQSYELFLCFPKIKSLRFFVFIFFSNRK